MSTLLAGFDGVVDIITGTLGMIIYPLFSIIFVLISGVQHVFEAFAGIGEMSFGGQNIGNGNTGSETDTGIVFYLLNYPLVKNMLISIMVLAIFLIVIFTAMAFIKNVYAAKSKNWKEIITFSIKGLANFFFIPVCCLLGIWLGNILLQAINGATSDGGAHYMDRKLFIASAYNANKYRAGEASGPSLAREAYTWGYGSGAESAVPDGLSDEEYAVILDKVYSETDVDIWTHGVGRHYVLWQVNYIVLVAGGIFMLYALGSLAFAMVKRLFYIVVLFVISPAICALYPIDEGKAVGSWKDEFIKQVVSAYGAVAGLNIFFSLIPLIDNIQLFSGDWYAKGFGINDIAQIFILTAGLIVVKDLIGLLSGFFSKGENAFSSGSALMKDSKGKVLAGTKKAQKYAGVFSMPIQSAAKGVWGATTKGFGKIGEKVGEWNSNRPERKSKRAEKKLGKEAFNYAKRHDMWKKDSSGKIIADEYDMDAAKEAVLNEMAKKAEGERLGRAYKYAKKNADKFGMTDDGRISDDNLKKAAAAMDAEMFEKAENKANKELAKQAKKEENKAKRAERWKNFKEGEFVGGLKDFGSAIYEETGMKKTVEDAFGAGEFGATRKRYADRTKARKEGAQGENKAVENVEKAYENATKNGKSVFSSEVAKAMGDDFADAVIKKMAKDKAFAKLGLGTDATKADLTNIDSIASRLSTMFERFNKANDAKSKEAFGGELKKYLSSLDTNGNEVLENMVQGLMGEVSKLDLTDAKVKLSDEALKPLNELKGLSEKVGEEMKDAFKAGLKEFADEVAKKKDKK